MSINANLLLSFGGEIVEYSQKEIIFEENTTPKFYYQLYKGEVKTFYSCEDGNEINLSLFTDGDSFGIPPLFFGGTYPASAQAISESSIICLKKKLFFKLLDEEPNTQKDLLKLLSIRLHQKTTLFKQIINQSPEKRIIYFLDNYKSHIPNSESEVMIPYTRQEIANFTGLRVETVIRTLKSMDENKIVKIENRKLYY